MKRQSVRSWLLVSLLGSFGCIDSTDAECVPGRQLECACGDGTFGAQRCRDDGTFEPCTCEDLNQILDSDDRITSDAGASLNEDDAALPDGGLRPRSRTDDDGMLLFSSGDGSLVDVSTTNHWVVIALREGLDFIDASGTRQLSWRAPAQLVAGTASGDLIAAVDDSPAVTFVEAGERKQQIRTVGDAELPESCDSVAFVNDLRLVCSHYDSEQGVATYYTLEGITGEKLTKSEVTQDRPGRIQAVPGSNRFVSANPAGFRVYAVDDNGRVRYLGSSPADAAGSIDDAPYSFDGNPAQRIISENGTLYDISESACADGTDGENAQTEQCIEEAGTLKALPEGRLFRLLARQDSKLYGLVAPSSDSDCEDGCVLLSIDTSADTLLSERTYRLRVDGSSRLLYEPTNSRILLARQKLPAGGERSSTADASTPDGSYELFSLKLW